MQKSRNRGLIILLAAALPTLILIIWSVVSALRLVPEYLIPAPWTLAQAMFVLIFGGNTGNYQRLYSGTFHLHALATLGRVGAGFALAVLLGIPAGVASGRNNLVATAIDPLVQAFRAVPGIAWLPLAMLWFGVGNQLAIFLIGLAAFFPVYLNTLHGMRAVPEHWLEAARMLGASRWQVATRVLLPAAMPAIETGVRMALGVSCAYVVLGESNGVTYGLGALIMDSRNLGGATLMLVGMLCMALFGCALDWCLMRLLRFVPGHRPATRQPSAVNGARA